MCSVEYRLLIMYIVLNSMRSSRCVCTILGNSVEDSNPDDGFGCVCVCERIYCESLYRIERYMHFKIGLSYTNIECVSSVHCYLCSSKWDNNRSLRTLNSTQTVWITLTLRKSSHKVFNVKYASKVWKYISTSIKYVVRECLWAFFLHYALNIQLGSVLNMFPCEKLL